MNILIIGGSGFIGPYVIRDLAAQGHRVAVFHRGNAKLAQGTAQIIGDRHHLAEYRSAFAQFGPDVVIDVILSSGAQAKELMATFRGVAKRVVALSSMDVYRAVGVLHGTDPGPLQSLPLTEDSELRTKLHPYPPQVLKLIQGTMPWVDDEYDKIPVEQAVMSDGELPGTVLRLPMVYGPGDHLHRFFPVLKRMDDGRAKILFDDGAAAWRSPRGYVENVAAAVALAATSERAAGRIYNVCEEPAFSELEWAKKIAGVTGWRGEFVVLPRELTPKHLLAPGNRAQHWEASSTRIRQELGYRDPVNLEEALRRTIEWERANPPQVDPAQFDYAAEDAAA